MKKMILILSCLLLFPISNLIAQGMPVYDNTNFISLAKSLMESAKQTSQLLKTVDFLKQQKENLEKVNNAVKQIKAFQDITENHQRLIVLVRGDLRNILNSPYIHAEEVNRISNSFTLIIDSALDDYEFVNKVLSSDFLKMTDAERTMILKEKENASRTMISSVMQKTKRYNDIIDFRRMQDKVNNRATAF